MMLLSRVLATACAVVATTAVALPVAGTAAAQSATTPTPSAGGPFAGLSASPTGNPFAGLGATSAVPAATATTGVTLTGIPASQVCPKVQIVAVQGTGESSDSASITADSGMLGRLVTPVMVAHASDKQAPVARAYVPYAADFGFKGVPYSQSMPEGMTNLEAMVASIHGACPGTKFVIAGYSQGADIADQVLRKIGQGQGPIDADLLAAGMLFSSPTRAPGSALFPGTSATGPAAVPGTDGTAVKEVAMGDLPTPTGGGISPTAATAGGLGKVAGRVASFCVPGDLACDTPQGAPIARLVANVAGQADLSDPVVALTSVGTALANTALKTAATVVTQDVKGDRIDTLDYRPGKSISQRLAEASDPRAPMPDPANVLHRLGTIALNSMVVIAKKVITPANIIQLATVGMANPYAALTLLGTKVVGAVGELVAPATGDRLIKSAFTAVQQNVTDNKDLAKIVTDTRYWDTVRAHGSYGATPMTPTGDSAIDSASKWIQAVVSDVSAATPTFATPTGPFTTATATPVTSRPSGSTVSLSTSAFATTGLSGPLAGLTSVRAPTTP